MWADVFAKMAEGLSAGAVRLGSAAARREGMGSGRYAALRMVSRGRKIVTGSLARGAIRGGKGGAFSRVALAALATRRARKRGKPIPGVVLGALAKDFVTLGGVVAGLPPQLKAFAESIATSISGLNQFSGMIAQSEGQLLATRIRNTLQYAQGIQESEAYKNRSQGRLEKALLPFEKFAGRLLNYSEGFLKNALSFGLEGLTQSPVGAGLGIGGALAGGYAGRESVAH